MEIPGIERGFAVAAFAGAVAYLCVADKMPAVRAAAYVVAGGIAASYIGPGLVEYMGTQGVALGERSQYALVFITGVGGIWLLHLIVAILQALKLHSSGIATRILNAVFKSTPPQEPPPPETKREEGP